MKNGTVLFENVRFTVITESLIRCEYSKSKSFLDNDTLFAVNRKYNGCEYTACETENTVTVTTSEMSLTYKAGGENKFTAEKLYGTLSGKEWHYGDKNEENLGGTLSTLDGVEGYTKTDDGILSKDGWFVYDDSENLVLENDWIKTNFYRDDTDLYIFSYGKNYKKALKTLFYVSGKPALPRKYVFGSWYSRWWPYTDEEILGIVDGYDKHDFPLDIMVIDMDWHHHDWTYVDNDEGNKHKATYGYAHAQNLGWTGYSWNRNLIKEPKKMLEKLHERNIYVTLNDHPHDGIRTHEDGYDGFMRDMGLDPKSQVNLEFDLSDRKYMDAFFKNAQEPLERDGVDFWWVDWQQDGVKPVIKGTSARHLKWLNPCYFKHTSKNGKRGISYSRWSGFGDQKHPIYFSGDTKSTWECLKFEVEFTAQSSNAGLFYWGHDTGGFFGDRDPEMYVRWTQFTAFSACLRVHSQRDELLDRCPWKWGEEAENAMRKVYHLRSQLIPYIYSLAYNAYANGTPLLAPMYYEYPKDENAYKHSGQYIFGDAFICAPVTEPMKDGKASQTVWIKDGVYYDWFTNEKYESGIHEFSCPLDEFPLLVKGGIPIPMQPYAKRMTSQTLDTLIIKCYPGEKGEFVLYEDDGITSEYLENKCLKTKLAYENKDGEIALEIKPSGLGYDGMTQKRNYRIELPLTEKMTLKDGTECKLTYENGCNIITVSDMPVKEAVKVVLK